MDTTMTSWFARTRDTCYVRNQQARDSEKDEQESQARDSQKDERESQASNLLLCHQRSMTHKQLQIACVLTLEAFAENVALLSLFLVFVRRCRRFLPSVFRRRGW